MSGRTTWYPSDSIEHDRELNVELGEEFGPGGPLVMRVMKDLAAQQSLRTGGHVRTGFRSLAKKCFIDRDEAERIVRYAAEIGALDDLVVDADGRRFHCRVSGWDADYRRGKATLKKADQRASEEGDMSPSEEDMSPTEATCPPKTPPTEQNRTNTDSGGARGAREKVVRFNGKPVPDTVLAAAEQVFTAFNAKAGTSYRPFGRDGKPSQNLSRVLGAMLGDERLTADVASRMIDLALSNPRPFWGDSTPHLGHVFGPNVVEAGLERALNPARTPSSNRDVGLVAPRPNGRPSKPWDGALAGAVRGDAA